MAGNVGVVSAIVEARSAGLGAPVLQDLEQTLEAASLAGGLLVMKWST